MKPNTSILGTSLNISTFKQGNCITVMNALPNNSIFLAGVPASGKTYFGNWLESNQGYLHLDIEKKESAARLNLTQEVNKFWKGDYNSLFVKLAETRKPIIFNYGFPPECLSTIINFLRYGLRAVWFTANKEQSREKFIERGTIDITCFDTQMRKIEANKNHIYDIFSECIIETLHDDGSRLSPEQMYKLIVQKYGLQSS